MFFALTRAALPVFAQGCEDRSVTVTEVRDGDIITLYAETTKCLDITVTVTLNLENMRSSQKSPITVESKGRKRMQIVKLQPADVRKAWRYQTNFHWLSGGRGGVPDGTVYQLPFDAGTPRQLIQGYGGAFSHQKGTISEFAHDWDMPEGTPVLAARGGVVVGVRQDSHAGGASEPFRNCANYVIIRHPDGTYAEYLHLKTDGAIAKLGSTVEAGAPIGYSGNTGFSAGPHLHFAVFRTIDGKSRESLPVPFQTKAGPSESLETGREY